MNPPQIPIATGRYSTSVTTTIRMKLLDLSGILKISSESSILSYLSWTANEWLENDIEEDSIRIEGSSWHEFAESLAIVEEIWCEEDLVKSVHVTTAEIYSYGS